MVSLFVGWGLFSFLTLCYYLTLFTKRFYKIDYIILLSGSTENITKERVHKAVVLSRSYPNATIIASGKEKSLLMEHLLREKGIQKYVLQVISTNTYEDALYCRKFIHSGTISLVTHPSHGRRSAHTFEKVYNNSIQVTPTSLFTGIDSCLLPTGWVSAFINLIKDIRYNARI